MLEGTTHYHIFTQYSQMQAAANEVVEWSDANHVNINVRETSEKLVGCMAILPPPFITFQGYCIE
jgi:hypothetical protein